MNHKFFDCDSHVIEVPDLWAKRVDAKYRDHAPKIVKDPPGLQGLFWIVEGRPPTSAVSGGYPVTTRDPKEYENWMKTARFEDTIEGGSNPKPRLKDMDNDGISATVLYPTASTHLFSLTDAPFQAALFRAYNSWITEFCSYAPQRLGAVAPVSLLDPKGAKEEIERVAKAGARGLMFPVSLPEEMGYNDPAFDPVWAAAAEANLPITFHHFTGPWYFPPNVRNEDRDIRVLNICTDFTIKRTLTQMIFAGVFERHPNLKIVAAEFEAAWLPYFMWLADHRFKLRPNFMLKGKYTSVIKKLPSEYIKKHLWMSLIEDPLIDTVLDTLGENRVMFSTDYPHLETTWPKSHERAEGILKSRSATAKRLITRDNGAELYRFSKN